MDLQFTKASNGQATCTIDGIRLHSAYNPSREASVFVSSIKCSFNPKYIFMTGPSLSYCVIPLRKMYPNATLCCVQYIASFAAADHYLWDKVFDMKNSAISLSEQLYNFMGDEGIASCLFLSWQPAEKAFPKEYAFCWSEIKKAVLKSRSVLTTRSFFSKRWTRNAIRFCLFARQIAVAQPGTSPVILCASGPSLRTSIPFIQRFKQYCTVICVSSALKPLIENDIVPDMCISTDGGYWAKRHISFELAKVPDIVLAMPAEAASYASVSATCKLLPLSYGDGQGDMLLASCGITSLSAERNGTVSGTAVKLALRLTNSAVFCCGLDLAPAKGFSHMQPNELELTDSLSDMRLCPKETRITPTTFTNTSLEMYQSWFAATDFSGRLLRISNNFKYTNSLGSIPDVDWTVAAQILSKCIDKKKITFSATSYAASLDERVKSLQYTIATHTNDSDWIHDAVPAESVILERSRNTPSEANAKRVVDRAMNVYSKDIYRAFGGGMTY